MSTAKPRSVRKKGSTRIWAMAPTWAVRSQPSEQWRRMEVPMTSRVAAFADARSTRRTWASHPDSRILAALTARGFPEAVPVAVMDNDAREDDITADADDMEKLSAVLGRTLLSRTRSLPAGAAVGAPAAGSGTEGPTAAAGPAPLSKGGGLPVKVALFGADEDLSRPAAPPRARASPMITSVSFSRLWRIVWMLPMLQYSRLARV
mmetsp:Transcript_29500/g.86015  ORF Transcript_29500/g.86015 Transcript_29500/m.86015 type:complete len:206 (-) Transcript_29500:1287-1904(-)